MPPDDPTVVVTDPEVVEDPQAKIDVTPPPIVSAEDQLAAKIKADYEALYAPRLKDLETRLQNQLQGSRRIEQDKERLQREVEQLKAQAKPAAAPADPWTGIENGAAWKAEVERVAEEKAEEKLKAFQAQQSQQAQWQQQQAILTSVKQRVIDKYPDLDPETGTEDSLVGKTYKAILSEHPEYLANPYGPVLAMYDMEEKLKTGMNDISGVGAGKPRLATASPTPSRTTPAEPGRIVLTREQKAFCDRYQIKYEEYAKTAAALEHGAVEV